MIPFVAQLQGMSLERWYGTIPSWAGQVGRKGEEFICWLLPVCLRSKYFPWGMNSPHSLVVVFCHSGQQLKSPSMGLIMLDLGTGTVVVLAVMNGI